MSGGILGNGYPQGAGILGGAPQPAGMGILDRVGQAFADNSGMLMGYGAGGFEGAMQGMQQDERTRLIKQKQAQEEQLRVAARQEAQKHGIDPALAEANPDFVFQIAAKKYAPKDLSFEERQFNLLSEPERAAYRKQKFGSGGTEYGLSPVYGTDAEGRPTLLQLGKNGTARQTPLPDGFNIARDPIKVEGPTGTAILDPQTRQQVGWIPKDVAGASREQEIGKADGAAIAGAGSQMTAFTQALDVVEQIKNHPNRTSATGWQSNFPTTKGGKTADFENLVEQAKGGAFMVGVQALRGLGPMSEMEAKAATAAVARMNIATTDEGFLKAVEDYEKALRTGLAKAQRLQGARGQSTNDTNSALKQKYGLE